MRVAQLSQAKQRLGGLEDGPWFENAKIALKFLKPPSWVREDKFTSVPAEIPKRLRKVERDRIKRIERCFMPHWVDWWYSETREARRDSMDEALEYLQLLELAIELGYLDESDVIKPAVEYMTNLLWAVPAWKFVDDYDYVSVQFLAARFGLHSSVQAPKVDHSGAVRFASTLSSHRSFRSNRFVETWIDFLDDYVQEEDEQKEFYKFLGRNLDYHKNKATKPSHRTMRRRRLLVGLVEFVDQLASAVNPLDDCEVAKVGTLYSYWLAKLFGYELSSQGYERAKLWKNDSWADAALRAPILSLEGYVSLVANRSDSSKVSGGVENENRMECVIKHGIDKLRNVWSKTERFISQHRELSPR